jgi:hypothetical protein
MSSREKLAPALVKTIFNGIFELVLALIVVDRQSAVVFLRR